MLMTDIYHYIVLNGRVSLLDLARRFHIKTGALEPMLAFWIKKGKLELITPDLNQCNSGQHCSDCQTCHESAQQIYQACG